MYVYKGLFNDIILYHIIGILIIVWYAISYQSQGGGCGSAPARGAGNNMT